MSNDIALYRRLLKIRESLKLYEWNMSDREDDGVEKKEISTNEINIESVVNDACFNELFNGVYPNWYVISNSDYALKKGHTEKSLIDYINIPEFKKDNNKKKYCQLCYFFLKDVIEFFPNGYKENTTNKDLKKFKTEKLKNVPHNSAEEFWSNMDEVLRQFSFKELIDKSNDTASLRKILGRFFRIDPAEDKGKEKRKNLKDFANQFGLAENFAISHYNIYLAWIFFCTSLQTADLGNHSRLKYMLYDYFSGSAVKIDDKGEVEGGEITSLLKSYYCGQDFWQNIYMPKINKMWQDATNKARTLSQKYITNPENVTVNEEEELNETTIVSLIKKETADYLLYCLLTTPMKKVAKNPAMIFKNSPNVAAVAPKMGGNSENRYLMENPPCIMFYPPLKIVEKEMVKKENVKTAYAEKKSKDERRGKIRV